MLKNGSIFLYQGISHMIISIDNVKQLASIKTLEGSFKDDIQNNVKLSNLNYQISKDTK